MLKLNNFSWKEKLSILIIITLLGIATIAGSGFWGLNNITEGFKKQTDVVNYRQTLLGFSNRLNRVENLALNLNTASVSDFTTQVANLVTTAQTLSESEVAANNPDLMASARQVVSLAQQYAEQRQAWVDNRMLLGFDSTDGALGKLSESSVSLEEQIFSMIEESGKQITSHIKSYVATRLTADEAKIEDGLVKLEAIVKEMGWQDIVLGKVAQEIRQEFEQTRKLAHTDNALFVSISPLATQLDEEVSTQTKFLETRILNKVEKEVSSNKQTAIGLMLVVSVVIAAMILISLVFIARQLTLQIAQMQSFLGRVAKGDFSDKLSIGKNPNDEFTLLRIASNDMVQNISNLVSQVVKGNEALLHIRGQLKQKVDQLGASSDEIEEKAHASADATQEISAIVSDVAGHSEHVGETAQSASIVTRKGSAVVDDCVNAMVSLADLVRGTNEEVNKLSTSGHQMLGIIDVINSLADQTNLLALNAAIESARAGDAGRGFSVVADEVRALAQKTVSATSSISEIVRNFDKQSKRMGSLMEEGIKLASSGQITANNAADAFKSIEQSIDLVVSEIKQVNAGIQAIVANSTQVTTQVGHIHAVSETARTAQREMAKSTQELSAQADSLGQISQRFKL